MDDQVMTDAPEAPMAVLTSLTQMPNIADHLDEARLAEIGEDVATDYDIDRRSMASWLERMKCGMDLANLVKAEKSYPWKGSSNARYPLVTTACLQFNAKAYPAIIPGADVVKCEVKGKDPQGIKAARAERVGSHMSYMLTSRVEEWEETTDDLLVQLPLVGTMYRKWWIDHARKRLRCRLVSPGALIVNEKVRSLFDAPRLTEELPLYPREIMERRKSGDWRDIDYVEATSEDKAEVQDFLEQHRLLDLDGDGYEEPYIVTIHKTSHKVARIVADFGEDDITQEMQDVPIIGPQGIQMMQAPTGKILSIKRGTYFVAYKFMPSLDGGWHGTGLGLLLGDISEAINTILNLMIDSSHMAARGGGFLGSEFRIKGGSQQFKPGEWKMLNMSGAAIKDSIVPMTFPAADANMFQLLGLLIDAGKEVSSIKDVITGELGAKNMPVGTMQMLVEQGMAQFTAAFKRIFRALRHEYRLVARLSQQIVTPEEYATYHDLQGVDPRADYNMDDMDILPVADPTAVTKMQQMGKASLLREMAGAGQVNPQAASKRILEAASIPDVEELLPQPDPMQQQMQAMQIEMAKADMVVKVADIQVKIAQVEKTRADTIKAVAEAEATEAETAMLGLQDQMAQLQSLRANLMVVRDGLLANLGRGAFGMAGAPGQQGIPGGLGPVPGAMQGGGAAGVVGGPPGF